MDDSPPPPPAASPEPKRPGLFGELRRRKVFRAAAVYLVVAWLVIQVASIVFASFEFPTWSMRMVIVLAALGFPLVIVLAWAVELTPEGVKIAPDTDVDSPRVSNPSLNRKRNWAAFGLGASVPTIGFFLVLGFLLLRGTGRDHLPVDERKTIAVLPFSNLSANEENAFFAGGVHQDVLTHLTHLQDLKVISRTSVMRFADTERSSSEIGSETGAGFIVSGSVQRAGEQIRVSVQLIDVSSDRQIWAENYDRSLSNVFAVQSEIAQKIAAKLQARIRPAEMEALDAVPTQVVAAHDAYLKAREIMNASWMSYDQVTEAIGFLRQAIDADPAFVEAWGLLAQAESDRAVQAEAFDDESSKYDEARRAASQALAKAQSLAPDHLATLRAQGFYQHVVLEDYVNAMRTLDRVLEITPNDAEAITFQGYVYRRLSQLDQAIENFLRAYTLDPANPSLIHTLAFTYQFSGDYAEMVPLYERLAVLEPEMTNYLIEARYYDFLATGGLAEYQAYKDALANVQKTEQCNLSTWCNGIMVVSMLEGQFDDYAREWEIAWKAHYDSHGDWVCPIQINDEANHAALLIKNGSHDEAEEVVTKALHEITLPMDANSGCTIETDLIDPKLRMLIGDLEGARKSFNEALLKKDNNPSVYKRTFEKSVLLETADMVAPEQVYSLYREVRDDPLQWYGLEMVCANPWIFPNLIKDPRFQAEVRSDGRFVDFLTHFGFMNPPA